MLIGILFTIGVILVLGSRLFYGLWDLRERTGDSENEAKLIAAVISDLIGTALVTVTLLQYFNVI